MPLEDDAILESEEIALTIENKQVRRNRQREKRIGIEYVAFLFVISCAVVLMCVRYIRLKTQYLQSVEAVQEMEEKLHEMKKENDALYEEIKNTLSWAEIKRRAIEDLGMDYPKPEQIVYYERELNSGMIIYSTDF